jgi:transposase
VNLEALKAGNSAGLSDRVIAEVLGVSDETTRKYRHVLELAGEIQPITMRVGRDGRTQDVSRIGKKQGRA